MTTLAQALQASRPGPIPPSIVLGTMSSTSGVVNLDNGAGALNCLVVGSSPPTGKRVLVIVTNIGNFVLGPLN